MAQMKKMRQVLQVIVFLLAGLPSLAEAQVVLVEAESFENTGGWVIDQQFMDQMGSPFLLAHGLGVPVKDAETTVKFPATGEYQVWVRTRDWAPDNGPGRFKLSINGKTLDTTFGADEVGKWVWQKGGTVAINQSPAKVALKDLTGFEGRCDAILFVRGLPNMTAPPDDLKTLAILRKKVLGLPEIPLDAGRFDVVVVGGGMAGCCAAVSAARCGLKVAFVQDRPVLGGNNSSEVRVWLGGFIGGEPFPKNGDIVKELSPTITGYGAGGKGYEKGDQKKLAVIKAEKNITLFLNHHVLAANADNGRISSVTSKDIVSGRELRFIAPLFIDCTGDGQVGFLAGAEYRYGREGRDETGERTAPAKEDKRHMGPSNLWGAGKTAEPSPFPACSWALKMPDEYMAQQEKASKTLLTTGDWTWETGFNWDAIEEAERIRDHNFRAMYGTWDYLKNRSPNKDKYANWKLSWCGYIAGKRESRRLIGDYVLNENDLKEKRVYPDGCVTTTWAIDLHSPQPLNTKYFPGQEFRSLVAGGGNIEPYPIPFRCLYSKNIGNLMMAGRDISVTHVALGTVRVMRTTGMMGVVVGRAAYLCKKHKCQPRDLYTKHLKELKDLLARPEQLDTSK